MKNQGMRYKKQIAGVLFIILLMAVTFRFYLKGYSYHELIRSVENANTFFLFIGIVMMVLFVSCEALNIYMIMKVLGSRPPFRRCIQYSCVGFYFSSITPSASAGQPLQIFYMKKDDIPVTVSSITIFFIVFVYQVAMIISGFLMFLLRFSTAMHMIYRIKYLFLFGFIVNTGLIFLLFLLMFSKKLMPFLASILIKAGKKLRFIKDADRMKEKLHYSMESYQQKAIVLKEHPGLFIRVLLVTLVQMTALNMIPALVYRSLGNPPDYFMDLIACQSLLTISTSAVPLPGAEGVAQGGFMQVFSQFFESSILASAMLMNRIISFYIPLALSFLVYIFIHIRIARKSYHNSPTHDKQ